MLQAKQPTSIRMLFLLVLMLIFSCEASASCRVSDMVNLYKQGSGKTAISEACDEEVDDAPECKFSKVLSLVFKKNSAYTIVDDCKTCENPSCLTNYGECSLTHLKKGSKEGDQCGCMYPAGIASGVFVCD